MRPRSRQFLDGHRVAGRLPGPRSRLCLWASGPIREAEADLDWSPEQGSCEATVAPANKRSPEHMRIIAACSHAGFLILRLRSYPAWRVR